MLAGSSFGGADSTVLPDDADALFANHFPSFSNAESYNPAAPADLGAALQRDMIKGQEFQNQKAILESIPHGPYGITVSDL